MFPERLTYAGKTRASLHSFCGLFLMSRIYISSKGPGSYMSVHVLLSLLNKLTKEDEMRGLSSILLLSATCFIYLSMHVRLCLSKGFSNNNFGI